MENALFLQSEVENPWEIYMRMLAVSPVYCDTKNNIVAVYSYELCKEILTASYADIPQAKDENGLNETALLIKKHLVRTANEADHIIARKAAMEIFASMKPVSIPALMDELIDMDWVDAVAKKLPVL